jgi:hypothetical protein
MSTNKHPVFVLKNSKSHSSVLLSKALGAKRILVNSLYTRRSKDTIINWDVYHPSMPLTLNYINHPLDVLVAKDKLATLILLKSNGIRVPSFTSDYHEAYSSLDSGECSKVMCRTLLRSSGGRGIVVARSPTELVDAPLYTRYIPKLHEFRVHVIHNVPKLIQLKIQLSPNSLSDRGIVVPSNSTSNLIRNLDNGWVYTSAIRGIDASLLRKVESIALSAVSVLQLHFSAVDVIVSKSNGLPYVLEVNTAPGLSDITLPIYLNNILN